LIMLEAEDKAFVLPCALSDAQSCAKVLKPSPGKQWDGPYDFLASILSLTESKVAQCKLMRGEQERLFSSVCISSKEGKSVRLSSSNASMAVLFAIYNDAEIMISKADLRDVVDCSSAYNMMKRTFPLWPLPIFSDTESLKALSEFMDEALPNGSVFLEEPKSN